MQNKKWELCFERSSTNYHKQMQSAKAFNEPDRRNQTQEYAERERESWDCYRFVSAVSRLGGNASLLAVDNPTKLKSLTKLRHSYWLWDSIIQPTTPSLRNASLQIRPRAA